MTEEDELIEELTDTLADVLGKHDIYVDHDSANELINRANLYLKTKEQGEL